AGEEGEPFGGGLADRFQPGGGEREGLLPGAFLEAALAAGAGAAERRFQAGGRAVLHDPGGALAAEDAPVHRVVAVALDVVDLTALEVDIDAAAAGAHVAGG